MALLRSLWRGPDRAPNVHSSQSWDSGPGATRGHANAGFPHRAGTCCRRAHPSYTFGEIQQVPARDTEDPSRVIPKREGPSLKQGEKSHHSRSMKGSGWGAGVGFPLCESRSGHRATRASARGSPVGFCRCSTRRATEFKFDACEGDGLRVATWRPTAAAHRDGGGPHPHGQCSRPGTELAHWVHLLQSSSPWSGDVAVKARVPWHCLSDCRAQGLSGTSAQSFLSAAPAPWCR